MKYVNYVVENVFYIDLGNKYTGNEYLITNETGMKNQVTPRTC